MSQQSVPDYLNSNKVSLVSQWNRILQFWDKYVREHPTDGLLQAIPGKIDAITRGGLKEIRFKLGGHQYNSSSIVSLLKTLNEKPDSISPSLGDDVSLERFIISTITPVAATGPDDNNIQHIRLYVRDDQGVTRLLNQAEINWFFTGVYNPDNQNPIERLKDPQRGVVTVSELIYIYNAFFKRKQTTSGTAYGGKTIKRRKAQRVTKMSHRRFSSKRTTRYSNRRTRVRRATRPN